MRLVDQVAKEGNRRLLQALAFIVIYLGFAQLSRAMAGAGHLSPIWVASGLAAALLVSKGWRWYPVVALATALNLALKGMAPIELTLITIGNTLEALAIWVMLSYPVGFDRGLSRTHDVFRFLGVALAAPLVSSVFGYFSFRFSHQPPIMSAAHRTWTWWTGNMLGILVLTSSSLAWRFAPRPRLSGKHLIELAILGMTLVGAVHLVFSTELPVTFALVPLLIWAALRFGPTGGAMAALLISVIAIAYTGAGFGPFAAMPEAQGLLTLQFFIATLAVLALLLATAVRAEGDRARAEASRREVERLRHFANSIPSLVWEADGAGNILLSNVRWDECVTGVAGTGNVWSGIAHPDDLPEMYRRRDQSLATGETFVMEYRLRMADGQYRWHLGRSVPMRDEASGEVRWFGTATDIEAQKRAEAELQRSRLLFQRIAETTPDILSVFDLTTKTNVYSNGHSLGLLGLPLDEAVPSLLSRIHPDDASAAETAAERYEALGDAEFLTQEYRVRHLDGSYHWLRSRGTVFSRDADGRPREVLALIQDVTQEKNMMVALRDSEERLRLALDAGQFGIWDWDIPNDHVSWSKRTYELYGMAPGSFGGSAADFAALVHPEDRAAVDAQVTAALATGSVYRIEFRFLEPGGGVRWLATNGCVLLDGSGKAHRMLGIAYDVTETKLVEARLRQAKEVADAANAAKSTFLANMSHEIRTPLGAMLGFSEFLLEPEQTAADREDCVQAIRRNGQLLARIVDDVLDLSKIEADRLETESLLFPLAELVVDLEMLLGLRAAEKGLTLTFRGAGDPGWVRSDPVRLRQILGNVIGNAVKFTATGGVTVDLAIEARPGGGRTLRATVRDSGIGLSDEQRERLFLPFSQADSSTARRFGGTGLGLALSRRLARALGGDLVLVESALGQGATFAVTVDAGEVGEALASSPVEAAVESLAGANVLVVDDAPDNRMLIGRFLRAAGAEVATADDGRSGVEGALAGNFDLIVMDLQMPEVDGYRAMLRLRQAGYSRPIIALTAHALKSERDRALRLGFDDYLTKPVNRKALMVSAARLIAARRGAGVWGGAASRNFDGMAFGDQL